MNKKRIMIGSLCLILLFSLIGGTYAWFYVNEEVTVSYGNSVFCEAGDSLEISLLENGVANRWTSSIDYSAEQFSLVDISGDGTKLYRPTEIDEEQQPVAFLEATSTLESGTNYDYIEMELAFRSVTKMNVYLSEESFIQPVNTDNYSSNIYGNFSRDYIAGAMRVAVIEDSQLKLLWAPNSKYQLIRNENGSYQFKTGENGDSVPESAYYYYGEDENGKLVQKEIPTELYAKKTFVVDSTGARKGHSGSSPVIVSLNPDTEGGYDQKNVKIRIWFEGTDREAHQALAGGNVNVKLKFVGVAKETDVGRQAAVDAITFNQTNGSFTGLAQGMVFSTDGRKWTEYTPDSPNLPKLESGSSIYIKYPESELYFETDYITFTKN